MADSDKKEFKPTLVLENGALLSIQIKKPKETADGTELKPSKTVLALEFDTQFIERYFGVLAKLLRKDRPIAAGFAFVEQLELPKAAADKNGSGPAPTGLEPIPIASRGVKAPPKKKREKAKT